MKTVEIEIPLGYDHQHPKLILKKGKPDKIIINLKENGNRGFSK